MAKNTVLSNQKPRNSSLKSFIKLYAVILFIFIAFVVGIFIGSSSKEKVITNTLKVGEVYNQRERPEFLTEDIDFEYFWEVWQIIKENYVYQPVNETELLYGAMAGSVASLADPHSVFFDPQVTQEFTSELKGIFQGIGAEIAIKNDRLTIVAPLPNTPAENAGLRSGDKIYAIDAEDTTGISLDYAVSKIRGPENSEVVLTISRNGLNDLEEITIVRSTIKIETVIWQELDDGIIHLELTSFNEDTADAFNKAVWEIVAKNPKGVILDLRNNPGGFLDTAISVTSEWVENGVVVYERMSDGELKKHKARGRARLKDFSTVVLINQGSASGSEILAGALKDYDLATLIGETTFGKGTVQSLFSLKDGSSIKLTIAEWLTPNQNTIESDGIAPDIEIELTEEDFNSDLDPQLEKAIEFLKNN